MAKLIKHITLLLLTLSNFIVLSQEERSYIREGNKMFNDSNYLSADTFYIKALQIDSNSIEAKYNFSNSQLKQGKNDIAIKGLNEILNQTKNKEIIAKTNYNLGNAHANKQEWDKAVDAYKNSLRNNPKDQDARYNYAFAKNKLAKQQNQDNNKKDKNKDKKDQEKDKNKNKDKKDQEKNKNKNKDKKDQEKSKGDQDENKGDKKKEGENNKNKTDQQKKEEQSKAKAQKVKKKQAEQILRQLDKNEKNIQQKLIRAKMKKQPRKKIDKDW